MNRLLRNSEEHFQKYLTPNQFQTLSILISLLNQYKEVKIEKLATYFPLPILNDAHKKTYTTMDAQKKKEVGFPQEQCLSDISTTGKYLL